jgi:hypothetical protein
VTFNPVIPNRSSETTIRTYLLQRGTDAFRRMAGYTPHRLDNTAQLTVFSPLPAKLVAHADDMLNEACYETLSNCNPRVPYLLSLWMYMGRDFEHHLLQYKFDYPGLSFLKTIFQLLFDEPKGLHAYFDTVSEDEILYSMRIGIDHVAECAADEMKQICLDEVEIPLEIRRHEISEGIYHQTIDEVETAISAKTLEWAHLTDEDLLKLCVGFAWQLYHLIRPLPDPDCIPF